MNANLEEAASIAAEYVSSESRGASRSVCLDETAPRRPHLPISQALIIFLERRSTCLLKSGIVICAHKVSRWNGPVHY